MGPRALSVVEHLLQLTDHSVRALNACATLQKLCRTRGQARFELAFAKAIVIQSPTPKSICSIR